MRAPSLVDAARRLPSIAARSLAAGVPAAALALLALTPALATSREVAGVVAQPALVATSLAVTGMPATVESGSIIDVTVTAKTTQGGTATTFTDTVHFSSSDPLAKLPADYTFKAADNGYRTFTVTLRSVGVRTVTVTSTASAAVTGTSSGVAVSDTIAPKVSMPPRISPRTGQVVTTTGLPAAIVWSPAAENGTGVASYELARSTDGGFTWTTLSAALKGTWFATSVTPSTRVKYRVRAVDNAGNVGTWATSQQLTPKLHGEGMGVYAGSWSTLFSSSLLGGSAKRTTTSGSSVTFTVTARSVALIATVAPGHGSVHVFLNGSTIATATIDTSSATTSYGRIVWQRSLDATQTTTLKVVATGSSPVDIDGLAVVYADSTPPAIIAAPNPVVRNGTLDGASIPITVAWSGDDNSGGSGPSHFELAESTDGGTTWTVLTTTNTTGRQDRSVASGGSIRYRARIVDLAGNVSAWVAGDNVTPTLQQSTIGVSTTGAWSTATSTSYSGGSTRYTSAAGASATFTFTGRSVGLVMTRLVGGGDFQFKFDGGATSLYVGPWSTTTYQIVRGSTSWAAAGSHTVTLSAVGNGRVDFDAIVILK